MNINFIFTNFNNSLLSIQAIESIWAIEGLNNPYIVIVDNRSISEEVLILKQFEDANQLRNLHFIYLAENIGYFKGLNAGINFLNSLEIKFDYFVIGNNDLIFSKNFYHTILKNHFINEKYPVISPNLITLDGVHQNPHVTYKISNSRKLIYKLYFSNYQVAQLIIKFSETLKSFTSRKDSSEYNISRTINMGYGACYLLTKRFFDFYKELDAPTFLMGEEAFLSHQIHSKELEIYYDSEINIVHYDHASCGKVPAKKMWQITRESYKLYKKFI